MQYLLVWNYKIAESPCWIPWASQSNTFIRSKTNRPSTCWIPRSGYHNSNCFLVYRWGSTHHWILYFLYYWNEQMYSLKYLRFYSNRTIKSYWRTCAGFTHVEICCSGSAPRILYQCCSPNPVSGKSCALYKNDWNHCCKMMHRHSSCQHCYFQAKNIRNRCSWEHSCPLNVLPPLLWSLSFCFSKTL